jgi:tetratricopeptide (TPR) repeat protein
LERVLRGTAALWAIGAAAIALKQVCEFLTVYDERETLSLERLPVALNVYWLNWKTVVWPSDLAVFRCGISPESWLDGGVILGAIAIGLTCIILWMLRRRKLMLFGLVWYGLALGPTSQIMPHHIQRADRFLYLPLVGLALASAAGLQLVTKASSGRAKAGIVAALTLGLLALGARSARQVQTWRNAVSMWENCVRLDPDGTIANCALADNLAREGQSVRAVQHYERALRSSPNAPLIMGNLARLLATCREEEQRDYERAVDLATRAFESSPRHLGTLALVRTRFAGSLAEGRQFRRAIREYEAAIDLHPVYQPALLELASLLATCEDERLRDADRAVRLAEQACELADQPGPEALRILAKAYAEANRFDEAVATAKKAIQRAQAAGRPEVTSDLERELKAYQRRALEQEVRYEPGE